jgi:hypothetical protein
MTYKYVWFVARNHNKRPTLSHALDPENRDFTLCNTPAWSWSKDVLDRPLLIMMCRSCGKAAGLL